ncbi:uncharacterized transposon-derived protein F54H12.3 [Trichonephila clavipes]|nr:uncharacterized transposon-derived protein F54H12.3 [Trichonephila clavipes]
MSSFLGFCEWNTRNRWRDGQVCPDVDKELWRLGPDSSGDEETGKKRTSKRGENSSEKRRANRLRKRRGESQSFLLDDADQESETRMSKNALRSGRRQAVDEYPKTIPEERFVRERVLLNGENLDQLRDSYERVLKCVKNKLLTYTLSEYVMAEVDRLPEIDSFYYDVDSPHGLHELFDSLLMSIEPVYKNHENPASFGGVNALYRALDNRVKTKDIKQWLETKESYTLHKPARRRFKRNRVLVGGIEEQFQADLLDLQSLSQYNNGYKYLLTCIDVFSKYAWAIPLRDKKSKSILKGFEKIFRNGSHCLCKRTKEQNSKIRLYKPILRK